MPKLRQTASQGLGLVGTVRNFYDVIREISFDEVRDEAQAIPWLLVLGPTADDGQELASLLTGLRQAAGVTVTTLDAVPADLKLYDAIVVYDPAQTSAVDRLQQGQPSDDGPVVFPFTGINLVDEEAAEKLRARITTRLLNRAPAFGRAYPAFRAAATAAIVDETAKANGQFALVANVPSVFPVIGSIASAGADFIVLTKNQMMMIFKIAAIYGRDLHDQVGILTEMVPVVGAGLVWRTIAREATSFIPFAAGTIPKVIIAYAGTVAIGRGAEVYYRSGRKATKEQIQQFTRQAVDAVKKLPLARGEISPAQANGETTANERATQPLPAPQAGNGIKAERPEVAEGKQS